MMFHNTGVGSFTILSALSDVTLTNVDQAGIEVPVVAVAVTATADAWIPAVAVTVPVTARFQPIVPLPVDVIVPLAVISVAVTGASIFQDSSITFTSFTYKAAPPVRRTSLLNTFETLLIF